MLNRRKLFGWLAASPFLGGLITKAAASPSPAIINDVVHVTPVGYIVDEWFHVPSTGVGYPHAHPVMDPCHCHAIIDPGHGYVTGYSVGSAMRRRMIYDGNKFVEFDSQDGADVLNRVIQGKRSA